MTKKLKSFQHTNAARTQTHMDNWNAPRRNGLACPKCKEELWDSEPDITIETQPPQKKVMCKGCGYVGHRVA